VAVTSGSTARVGCDGRMQIVEQGQRMVELALQVLDHGPTAPLTSCMAASIRVSISCTSSPRRIAPAIRALPFYGMQATHQVRARPRGRLD